ncbi:ThuA domain-containing protein [Pedobacter nyackensis]|uniref:ThuA domain-containing protein n=1 Tax=Pedobacter nyackensis TaxID=475255 RepID=UPI00292D8D1D|nr:ThuA domain-containing protein [Pedobacter nyackensis]
MPKILTHFLTATLLILFFAGPLAAKKRILVFSKTAGFHHSSIKVGVAAIQKLGLENKFEVDTTIDAQKFTPQNLRKYAAVVFLNTTGDVLNDAQQAAFEQYIKKGGGYVGVHAATDTEYDWPWYGKLSGAYFISHPAQQVADLMVVKLNTIATKHLPAKWTRKDEWYNFRDIGTNLNVLIKIDEDGYTGGKNGDNHPVAWYHDFDGGRSFYTALGHTEESYADPLFLKHVLGGIQYAMGIKKME